MLFVKVFVFVTPTDIAFSIGGERERVTRHASTLHNFLCRIGEKCFDFRHAPDEDVLLKTAALW